MLSYYQRNKERIRIANKKRYEENKEEKRLKQREYRLKNLESIRIKKKKAYSTDSGKEQSRLRIVKKLYGLSKEQYKTLVDRAAGICELCLEHSLKTLNVDHNHTTGNVRGLLCANCNKGIGMFDDSISKLKMAILYLEKYERNTKV